MPILDLGDWEKKITKYTAHCLWATMCFPQNMALRQQYLNKMVIKWKDDMKKEILGKIPEPFSEKNPFKSAILNYRHQEFILQELEDALSKGFKKYYLHAGGGQTTLESPAWDKILDRIDSSAKGGGIAGSLLLRINQLHHHYPDGGSVGKARHLLEYLYEKTHLPSSPTSIKNAWKDFKTVAHFWAAFILFFSVEEDELINPFKQLESILLGNLPSFLGYSEYFREFGENHFPNTASKNPTLTPEETWGLPEGFPFDKIANFAPPKLDERELEIMTHYKAPIDNR